MRFLLALIGFAPAVAHASTLDTWGSSNSGVAQMWGIIRGTLYTRADPVMGLSNAVVNFVFPMIGGAAVLLVLYAGIRMIYGRGQEDAVSQAKTIILYALVGVILGGMAATIVSFFYRFFFPTILQ